MILIGMYDSPFVRRAAVTLHHHGLAFDRRPISVFRDFADVQAVNPLGRVPALALDDGTVIADSTFILDHLDELAGPARALTPPRGPARLEVQGCVAIALGLMEKSVEYRTETYRRAPGTTDGGRVRRLEAQIAGALEWLDGRAGGPWLCGQAMTQADVTSAIAHTNLARKSPALLPSARYPAFAGLAERCEALACFRAAPFVEG